MSERICEQIADVSAPQVVEQVLGVPKISSRDRILQGTMEEIIDVLVPAMVEQSVKLPKTVSDDGTQQRTVERIADIPVPQVVEELVEVFKLKIVEKINETSVIQTVQERSAVLAQLASRISAIVKFWCRNWRWSIRESEGLDHGIDQPIAGREFVSGQPESVLQCGDVGATEKEDLEADIAKQSSKFETGVDGEISARQVELGVFSERQLQMDTTHADERDQDCEVLFRIQQTELQYHMWCARWQR